VKQRKSIRFCVGQQEGVRASTWNLFAEIGGGKNDVYLACREQKGAWKVSLHQSGKCHAAFDNEYLQSHSDTNEWPNRFIEKWEVPNGNLGNGYTLAYRIVTPLSSVNVSNRYPDTEEISWISSPSMQMSAEICIVLSTSSGEIASWPGKSSLNTKLIDKFQLDNGTTVYIVSHEIETPQLCFTPNPARYFNGCNRQDLNTDGLRCFLFETASDGSRVIYDVIVKSDL
jgi:hypothetical protein